MKPANLRTIRVSAGVALSLLLFSVLLAPAQTSSSLEISETSQTDTASELDKSPVEAFRKLLAMTPAELDQYLTNYPATKRDAIRQKVQEYKMLPPPLGEQRLEVTELRWYLLPLLKSSSTNRTTRLSAIPQPYRQMVSERLEQWDMFPPQLRDEVLEYETTMHYFVGGSLVVKPQVSLEELSGQERSELERRLQRWEALPLGERQQMYASFRNFFDLNEKEKQKTLDALAEPERQQTEKALDPVERWPRAQQEEYIAAFKKFAGMSGEERQVFLRNVERWRKMTPAERQAYRDLVHKLAQMPPLPPGATLSPPKLPAATNVN